MALIQFRFYSNILMRQVSGRAILPFDGPKGTRSSYPTLFLFHGLSGDDMNWLLYTDLYRMAQEQGIAVILPNGENMFYRNNASTAYSFGDFFGKELVEAARAMFPLSHKREETFLAGFSMGGYGSLCTGMENPHIFGAIGAFSPALITKLARQEQWRQGRYPFHEWTVFGDISAIDGTDRDPHHLLSRLAKLPPQEWPRIYLGCGTEDELIHPVREFRGEVSKLGIPLCYYEGPGGHDYIFWQKELERFLEFISSGS